MGIGIPPSFEDELEATGAVEEGVVADLGPVGMGFGVLYDLLLMAAKRSSTNLDVSEVA
jgi:hypothetical protein